MLKSGYKTTEFVGAALVAIGSLIASLTDQLNPRYAAIASAVSMGLYALGRGIAKAGATMNPPTVVAAPVAPPTVTTAPPQ